MTGHNGDYSLGRDAISIDNANPGENSIIGDRHTHRE
jgi:hypothetical protein